MKKSNELIVIVALMVASFVVPNLRAQNAADTPEAAVGAPSESRREKARDMLGQMAKELGLSEEQKTQVRPIMLQSFKDGKAIMEDESLTPEQKREKGMALRKSTAEKMDAFLTPEQQAKAKEMRAARGGPEGGPGGKKGGKKGKKAAE